MTNKNNNSLILLSLLLMLFMSGCAALNPATQAEILKQYKYDVESVNDIKIAGTLVENLGGQKKSLASLPALAIGILRKDLPLEARINMKISNPTGQVAKINSFKYLIEIKGKPFFEGTVNDGLNIGNGMSTVIPLSFKANLFGVAEEQNPIEKVLTDVLTREGNGFIVLKIKPSIPIGNGSLYYPGYITVDNDLLKSVAGVLK